MKNQKTRNSWAVTSFKCYETALGKSYFVGRIAWFENGIGYLYSESTGINRLRASDAIDDADWLYNDRLASVQVA